MKYNLAATETVYNGIKFRSNLEAHWAAFFDITGWIYAYEPCGINGRVPDFILKCESTYYSTKNCIVEIKPNIFIDEKFKKEISSAYHRVNAHLLILDDFPFLNADSDNSLIRLGWGSQYLGDKLYYHGELYELVMKCENDFGSDYMRFDGMMYGQIERKQFLDFNYDYREVTRLKRHWYEAGNIIQFPSYTKTME